jgi:ribonuclease HI
MEVKIFADGRSVATAIDLTDDGSPPSPQPPGRLSGAAARQRALTVKSKKKTKAKANDPDIEELTSHRQLGFWKDLHFEKLEIKGEYDLVFQFPIDAAQITTIVPHRYLRTAGIIIDRQQRKVQTNPHRFPGIIRIPGPVEAVREAYEEHSPTISHDPTRLVFWTDGSGYSGSAVVYRLVQQCGRQFEPWTCYGFNVPHQQLGLNSTDMEYFGLIKALDIILNQARHKQGRWKEYSVYTDAMAILNNLTGRSEGRLAQHIINKTRAIMALGAVVKLHWVPGHSKVGKFTS